MPGFSDLNLMTHYGVSMPLPPVGDPTELRPMNPQKPDNEIDTSSVPQEPAPRPADVNQQLARLLTNVSRNSFAEVSVGELDALRPGLEKKSKRLTPEQQRTNVALDTVRAAAREAHEALSKIYAVSARELVQAYDDNAIGGTVVHIRELVNRAIEEQFNLAAELGNRRDVPDDLRERLDDLSQRASSRAAELCTLRSELVVLAETAKNAHEMKDPTVKLMLSKNLGELMRTMSGSMHGQTELVTRFENELKTFTDRANALEAKPGEVSDEEISALADAGSALAAELEKSRRSFPDEKLHAQLVLTLRSVRTRVDNLLQTAVTTARLDVRNILPQKPLEHLFGPTPLIDNLAKKMPTLAKLHETHQKFAEALEIFLTNPTKGNASKMKSAAKSLTTTVNKLTTKLDKLTAEARAVIGETGRLSSDPRMTRNEIAFLNILTAFARGRVANQGADELSQIARFYGVDNVFSHTVDTLAAHTDTFKTNLSRDQFSGADILRAMRGETTLSAVLESRINGATPDTFDPQLDDKNLVSAKALGSGAVNSVVKLTYRMPDNSLKSFAFKPEIPGQLGLLHLTLGNAGLAGGDAYKSTQHVIDLNSATRETAKLLGCDSLVGTVKATVHNGVFGLLMEMADGITASSFAEGENGNGMTMSFHDLDTLKSTVPAEYAKIRGEIIRQTTDLAWLDMLTGQGDRHRGNYLVNIAPSTHKVTVTGIDNDMCFADYRLGLGKIHISPARKKVFLEALKDELMESSLGGAKQLYNEHVKNDVLDLNDPQLPLDLRAAAKRAFAFRAGLAPQVMSRAMYNKLHNMTEADIRNWKDSLARRLDGPRAEQAARRLEEMRALAEKYRSEGRVIDDGQWSTAETNGKLVAPGEKHSLSNMEIHIFNRDFKKVMPFVDPNAPVRQPQPNNDNDGYSGDGDY